MRPPIGKATVGEAGVAIRSTSPKARSNSCRISVRARCAVP